MATLWNPDKQARAGINRGNTKERIARMKLDKILDNVDCPFCGIECYFKTDTRKFLTFGGSDHHCKPMPVDNI